MIALKGESLQFKVTSDMIAAVLVNLLVIRKPCLPIAGLIHVARGTGGAEMAGR